MARIVRNKLTDLIRERETEKRKIAHLAISLDSPLKDDESAPTPMSRIDAAEASDRLLDVELKIDLSKALQSLNPRQRKLCRLLKEDGLTIKEASEYLKIPRSTIYDELKRIRRIFMKGRLADYLE